MPNKIPFPRHLIYGTHATIRKAFNSGRNSIEESGYMGNINISDVITALIQQTGRFVENYASDLLFTLDHIRELCDNQYDLPENIDEIFAFGLRRHGVDHNDYIMSRLTEGINQFNPYLHVERYYRKILAVNVKVFCERDENGDQTGQANIICELRDITDAFIKLEDTDKNPDGSLKTTPFPDGNPMPKNIVSRNTAGTKTEKKTKEGDPA